MGSEPFCGTAPSVHKIDTVIGVKKDTPFFLTIREFRYPYEIRQ
jgi:hypothetical protein